MTNNLIRKVFCLIAPAFLLFLHLKSDAATMAVDSLSGPITAHELAAFKSYMATTTVSTDNNSNQWVFGHTAVECAALGQIYESTGDIGLLNRMIQYVDTILPARNDPATGVVIFTGRRDPVWVDPTLPPPIYNSCESGEVAAHILRCARLILQTRAIWNTTVPDGNPHGFGVTYFQRATNYLAQCDQTIDQFIIPTWVSTNTVSLRRIYAPTNWNGTGGANGGPVAWNRISMFIATLQRSGECHDILGDNPARVAKQYAIVQTNVQWFLSKTVPYTKNGYACYNWFYRADTTSKYEEVWEDHGKLDIRMLWEAYNRGIGLSKTEMTKFANTLQYSVWAGSSNVFHGQFDGNDGAYGVHVYTKGEYIDLAEFIPEIYTTVATPDQSHTTDTSMIGPILWMKDRRYQQFSVSGTPSLRVVNGGAGTNFTVSIASMGGTSNTVNLAVSGFPPGAGGSFSPASINLGTTPAATTNSTLSVTTLNTTPAGTYALSIVATNASMSHTSTVTLVVGTFTLAVSPVSPNVVNLGTNTSYAINVTTNNGFSGIVALGVTGLPTNSAASFSPATLSGAGVTTLGITTSNNTPVRNYALTVTGTNGSSIYSAIVTLIVTNIGITWGQPADITGDADIAVLGSAVYAYDWANANQTVNGVNFTGTTSTSGSGDGNVAMAISSGSIANNTTVFTNASGPFSGLSTAYKSILIGADFTTPSGGNIKLTVTLNSLVIGNIYSVQIWVNDPRASFFTRTETAASGNAVILDYNYNQTTGGYPGQYTTGTFTASATSQSFTLQGKASTQLNALQVRNVSPPASPPNFSDIRERGGSLVFSGANGAPGWTYYVLTSTNLTLPLNQWTTIATNVFDASGNFNFTNSPKPGAGQSYYRLRLQ